MARQHIKDRRKQELIEANLAAIAKKGYASVTIADVAGQAGMSRGIVNFYFDSKDAMMKETLAALLESYQKAWDEAVLRAGTNSMEALKAMINAHFTADIFSKKRLAAWGAFLGEAVTNNALKKLMSESEQQAVLKIQELSERLVSEGWRISIPPVDLANDFNAMIKGMWISAFFAEEMPDRKILAEKCGAYMVGAFERPRQMVAVPA